MRVSLAAVAVVSIALGAASAGGTVYHVSPGGPITSLKSIVNGLAPGDVVEVASGTYNEVMKVQCNGTVAQPITIRGVGPTRPIFDATGQYVVGDHGSPRGVFQVEGDNIIMENLAMANARNGNNGAGIRLLGSVNTAIRDCKISYCDMGMMGGDAAVALIEGCDVGFNGTPLYDGYSHNFYMDGAGAVIVRGCYIHDALHGQNFKSRAHYNELWYNWIADSNEGEVGPVDSSYTAWSNSNTLMVGNVVISKPNRTGNTSKYINFGSDSGGRHNGTMYIYNNTLIAGDGRIDFISITDNYDETHIVASNNIFLGSNDIVTYWWSSYDNHQGSHNWMGTAAHVPSNFTDTVPGASPGFEDFGTQDFRPADGADCIDAGTEPLGYVDGAGVWHELVVDESYLPGQGLVPRSAWGPIDIGAYEYVPLPHPGDAGNDGKVDGGDYTVWADNYGTTDALPFSAGGWVVGNFNEDTNVDGGDYTIWCDNYGYGAGGAPVPEPACAAVLALGLCALRRRRG